MYTRILIGSRISLGIGFMSVFFGTIIGTFLGLVARLLPWQIDLVVSRGMEVVLGIPAARACHLPSRDLPYPEGLQL